MISIAIDGPAGAGKSTIAKGVSKKLGYLYVDTGALYRTIALYMYQNGVAFSDTKSICDKLPDISIELEYKDESQHVILNGNDVSELIRTPEISMGASKVSAIPEVRGFLLSLQRELALKHNILMDGRDIGTVVLPNAQIKIFLTASAETRASRRYKELIEKGQQVTFEDVLDDINKRDYQDMHREVAPLKQAPDATLIDTSDLGLQESIDFLTDFITERINEL